MRAIPVLLMWFLGLLKTGSGHPQHVSDAKIVGGSPVRAIRQTPYMVFMQRPHGSLAISCGGSIVTPLWVVTACHCVAATDEAGNLYSEDRDNPLDKWKFVAGVVHLKYPGPAAQIRNPRSIHIHPTCQLEDQTYNDLALAKMKKAFQLNDNVKAVNMFSFSRSVFGNKLKEFIAQSSKGHYKPRCITAGWGSSKFESLAERLWGTPPPTTPKPGHFEDPAHLKSSVRYLMNDEACMKTYIDVVKAKLPGYFDTQATEIAFENKMLRLLTDQVCSQSKFKNETTCRGDSGGPLVCDNFLVGITIWNLGCGEPTPDVHQNLVPMLDWFVSTICNIKCRELKHRHSLCELPPGFEDKCNLRSTRRKKRTDRVKPKSYSSAPQIISPVLAIVTFSLITQNKCL